MQAQKSDVLDRGGGSIPGPEVDFLHEIGSVIIEPRPLHEMFLHVVELVSTIVRCDSCLLYMVEEGDLVLRASKSSVPEAADRPRLRFGQEKVGWLVEGRPLLAIETDISGDPRLQVLRELIGGSFRAFLLVPVLSRQGLAGAISLQHQTPHVHSERQIKFLSTIGFLVGAEIERTRLEGHNSKLCEQLETRKILERAKGILQRDLKLNEEQAYLALQRQSRQRRKSMREIGEAIILNEEIMRRQARSY